MGGRRKWRRWRGVFDIFSDRNSPGVDVAQYIPYGHRLEHGIGCSSNEIIPSINRTSIL
jgi:hypothetical protein